LAKTYIGQICPIVKEESGKIALALIDDKFGGKIALLLGYATHAARSECPVAIRAAARNAPHLFLTLAPVEGERAG